MYSKDSKLEAQVKSHAKSLGKDNVGVEAYKGKYRLNISRPYSRMHFPDSNGQKRIATGLSVLDANGKIDKANSDTIATKVAQMHNDLANGYFDATLVKYGLVELAVVDGGKKPEMTLLELYDWYCDQREITGISETHLKINLKGNFKRSIIQAIEAVGDKDAIAIRQWLIKNRSIITATRILSHLEKTYQLGIKHKGLSQNPFMGIKDDINIKKQNKLDDSNDNNEDSDKRAFTIDEMNAIIEAYESSIQKKHLTPIIKFLFWTGCRTGEAIGLKWRDIKWENEIITIRRTYNAKLKIFKPTKTGVIRFFPMPKDSKLWQLLKSISEGKPDEIVFKSRENGIICHENLRITWSGYIKRNNKGTIPTLVEQGKVKEYLKLYATRHTFISIQVNDFGIPPEVVAQWCGHDEKMSKKHYLERNTIIKPADMNSSPYHAVQQPQETLPTQVTEFLSGLTSDQIEQLKSLLNKQ